jgi:probable rRNA maturation factor
LKVKGLRRAELSILFAGKQRIRTLNKRFRKIDRPTDVLAFSMGRRETISIHPEILGDVVICPQIAQAAAKIYRTDTENEILLYLIHGILHLLGYNDVGTAGRQRMEKEQLRILKRIGQR